MPLWLGPALLILLSPVCLLFMVGPELRYHGAILEAPVQVWLRRPGTCLDGVARACVGFDAIPGYGILTCLVEAAFAHAFFTRQALSAKGVPSILQSIS